MSNLLENVRSVLNTRLFRIGDTPVTLSTLITALLVIITAIVISRLVRRMVTRGLAKRGGREGTIGAVNGLVHYVLLVTGISVGLQTMGVDLTALFAAGAVFAVGLGFAMKNIAENFVSGIILLVERSVRPGDVIHVDGDMVKILRMGIRASVVKTRDGEDIIMPNSVLVQTAVKNFTLEDDNVRTRFPVGVAYSTDLNLAIAALTEAARTAAREVDGVDPEAPPEIYLVEFGSSSVNLEVAMWLSDAWRLRSIRSQIAQKIWWTLKDQGIVIAFPQLDLHLDPTVTGSIERLAGRAA